VVAGKSFVAFSLAGTGHEVRLAGAIVWFWSSPPGPLTVLPGKRIFPAFFLCVSAIHGRFVCNGRLLYCPLDRHVRLHSQLC